MEISKASIKLLTYLDCFQKFSIPYEEEIKSKEIKTLLDHLCGKNKVYNQSIFNDIIERIEEKEKPLTIKEYIRAVIEAEHFIGLKIKKLENIKINYKRLLNKLDANLVYLQDREKKLQHYEIEGTENFFVVDIYHGENFELLQGDLDFTPHVSYLILKYFQAFKDTASQKIVRPVWNEKFRMYLIFFNIYSIILKMQIVL